MRNQEMLGFCVDFGLNINWLPWVTRINIFINHVCAHYRDENRLILGCKSVLTLSSHFLLIAFYKPSFLRFRSLENFFPQAALLVSTFYWFGFQNHQLKIFSMRMKGQEKMHLQPTNPGKEEWGDVSGMVHGGGRLILGGKTEGSAARCQREPVQRFSVVR